MGGCKHDQPKISRHLITDYNLELNNLMCIADLYVSEHLPFLHIINDKSLCSNSPIHKFEQMTPILIPSH